MKPAGERLAQVMADLVVRPPEIPVVHNVHAATESDPQKIKALLVEQIYSPVQWTRCVQAIARTGATTFVECGPGKVLSGLGRRIDKSLQGFSLEEPDELLATLSALKQH
jgi:[acyl-carrier-protein] S-malonyltransferase